MCVADGSVDFYTTTCPMCKVFRHSGRCPHKRETCRNRANHPRHDVVFITNAEVQTFNGCGYCKWARTSPAPPPAKAGMHNPGWPGCCRPPQPAEVDKVPPADWPAVHTVHRTPIPPDVRHILDAVRIPYGAQGLAGSLRAAPAAERKALVRANSSPNGTVRASPAGPVAVPQKARSGGSPQAKAASLTGSASRHPCAQPGASPGAALDHAARRAGPADTPLKRVEGFRTTPPASLRKLVDGEHPHPHPHPPVSRPSLTAANLSSLSPAHGDHNSSAHHPLKRRASASSTSPAPLAVATNRVPTTAPKAAPKGADAKAAAAAAAAAASDKPEKAGKSENAGVEKSLKALSLASGSSSSSGSRGGGSATDNGTVTSDGGFTDYLSDESEAELQRQAEVRAAILEQNRAEEQEFRAARQQLAAIDLRPPQAWTTGVPPPRKAINAGCARGG